MCVNYAACPGSVPGSHVLEPPIAHTLAILPTFTTNPLSQTLLLPLPSPRQSLLLRPSPSLLPLSHRQAAALLRQQHPRHLPHFHHPLPPKPSNLCFARFLANPSTPPTGKLQPGTTSSTLAIIYHLLNPPAAAFIYLVILLTSPSTSLPSFLPSSHRQAAALHRQLPSA